MALAGIALEGVIKTYGGNIVLDVEVCRFERGLIYGVIGTNGVGKTTMLEVISGSVVPDHGVVKKDGMQVAMIYHESGLFQEMTVCENMFLGREIFHHHLGLKSIAWRKMRQKTKAILLEYGLDVAADARIEELPLSTQKLLEVIIALSKSPDVIIIDEPLTLLDVNQIAYLNKLIKSYINDQRIVIYASHRLDDLFDVVDKVVTMREGKVANIQLADQSVLNGLLEFAERDIHKYPKRPVVLGGPVLEVDGLKTKAIEDVSFDLYEGEILGIIGLKSAYKSNIGKALFGAVPSEGRVRIDGCVKKIKTTTQAVEAGLCYIGSADEGMFMDDSLIENIVSANVPRARRLSRSAKRLISKHYLQMLNIADDKADLSYDSMSAGNRQKVLLAKWFFSKSKIFIFNKPTANIDVPSKVDIYNIFADLAESGAGIIMFSNDLEEVAGICDRALVIREGTVVHELEREELSVHRMVAVLQNWH